MIVRKDSMGHVDLSLCLTIFVLSEAEVGGDIWYWILKMSIFHPGFGNFNTAKWQIAFYIG
jgi:hypothetical protein